ncbi:MAG TPA: OmpA family protein [Candidatus Sulfotelmatobacter sp.]|nr:OmpA family protein [Candidatus Sulfotelmatobacter sp.]
MRSQKSRIFCEVLAVMVLLGSAAAAQELQTGKLKIAVSPKQAYTFVDDKAIGPGNRTIKLDVGTHHLVVANYGYKFAEQDVSIDSGHTVPLDIKLETAGGEVPGPRGRIQIEVGMRRAGDAAILLNGKKPQYFVGHVDEFNHNIGYHQELVVPPGTHEVTVTRYGKELWSGSVTVAADQRVILDISNGKQRVKAWPRGSNQLGATVPRFQAGIASATVAVAPVSGTVSANPAKIDCNQNTQLAWSSSETIDADMSGLSPVPTTGDKTISPRQTTVYELTATGPGGVTKPSTTVEVNPVVQSSLSASPAEIRYRRIGDKIMEQGSTTLSWSSSNADAASLGSLGSVDASGTKSLTLSPTQAANGPLDEEFKYTLTATNVCGGSDSKTVAVHLKGSIEPTPTLLLRSIFFPTDYPTKKYPQLGLVSSQQEALTTLAAGFKQYLEYDPDAKLSLTAYADERGEEDYNLALSELRAQRVKEFLASQGIAADKITTTAKGQDNPLDKATVIDLQSRNPNQPQETRIRNFMATWLAYNRRVDIVVLPTNAESLRFYPNQAADSEILWQRSKPEPSVVESNN